MSEVFSYEELTWPEIAELPRSIPLVIPLGEGYPIGKLAEALDNPRQIGLLPAIPYGWNSSCLSVPEAVLSSVLHNLLASLRDDGFSQVYALLPQGTNLCLGPQALVLPVGDRLRPASALPLDSDRSKVVLIPIGHTEQHAYHLPLNTDTLIIGAVARGTAVQVPEQAVSLPVMPYGVSTHRAAFAGTLNCGGRAFEDFWLAVIEVLVLRGFTQFYLLSGHGGNGSFLTNVVKYAGERFYQAFAATAWLYLSGPDGTAALTAHRQSGVGGMGHAGELETSLILHLRPDLVHMERAVDESNFITTPSYFIDWVEGGALIANPPWEDDTTSGAYGAGSLGSAEKGALWLKAAIDEKVNHVGEIQEQYNRRMQKRRSRSVSPNLKTQRSDL